MDKQGDVDGRGQEKDEGDGDAVFFVQGRSGWTRLFTFDEGAEDGGKDQSGQGNKRRETDRAEQRKIIFEPEKNEAGVEKDLKDSEGGRGPEASKTHEDSACGIGRAKSYPK
jgi:hypothetical protein